MPEKQKKRALKTAKVVNEYYIDFEIEEHPQNCLSYILRVDKVNVMFILHI